MMKKVTIAEDATMRTFREFGASGRANPSRTVTTVPQIRVNDAKTGSADLACSIRELELNDHWM